MKKLLLILFCLTSLYASAQKLTKSRTGSYYTYIYKISDSDLLAYYKDPDGRPGDKVLQHPIDSITTVDYPESKLPAGNYLKVSAQKNALQYTLIERHNAFIHILKNSGSVDFILTDREGNVIKDAVVKRDNKVISFDPNTGLYPAKLKKENTVVVYYKGIANFYNLEKNLYSHQPVKLSNWFKRKWAGIKRIFKKTEKSNNKPHYYPDYDRNGFIVFNKPKYKPRDTVRFKAYIFDRKTKKPIGLTKLRVKLFEEYDNYEREDGKVLGEVTAYAPGSFEYSFVLTDSLDISLDDEYKIGLEDPARFKAKADGSYANDADEDADDEEDEAKSKVFMAGKFYYEEYELKATKFTMRTDKDEHERGNLLNVYFKATDDNDLPVPDGRVEVKLLKRNIFGYPQEHVFIPDTLWQHKMPLDPAGETKLTLPDSIFPKADLNYTIEAHFFNSANEDREDNKTVRFNYSPYKISAAAIKDTLKVTGYFKGKSIGMKALVSGVAASGDTLLKQAYTLPLVLRIDPRIKLYTAVADSASVNYENKDVALAIQGYRTTDSVFVKIDNPQRVRFWYTLFAGNKQIAKGETDTLFYKQKLGTKGNVTCNVYYLWGGNMRQQSQIMPYQDQLLSINVNQPVTVYPGQKVKTEITVKNAKGQPAAGTDITAWALTSKFENYQVPFVPYLGKSYPLMKHGPYFQLKKITDNWAGKLNWQRWSREMGLDSVEYYKFTHPKTTYRSQEADSVTQIAPFVVLNGNIKPVHILYIDERPVYFSQAQHLQRYSFKVDSGYHAIRFRTDSMIVSLPKVWVKNKTRQVFSVNADSLVNKSAFIKKMPDTLTTYEAELLNKYLIKVENTFNGRLAKIEQGDNQYFLSPEIRGVTGQPEILTGPLAAQLADYSVKGDSPLTFLTEPGYTYTFLPGLLKQKSYLTKYAFSTRLAIGNSINDYTQQVVTQTTADTLWQNYLDLRSHTTSLFSIPQSNVKGNGSLSIKIDNDDARKYFVKNLILYRNDDPDFILVNEGRRTDFYSLSPGKYRLVVLLKQEKYTVVENILVKPNGTNYYYVNLKPTPRDSVSIKINRVIDNRMSAYDVSDREFKNDALTLKETFNEKYLDKSSFKNEISGKVVSASDLSPIPGASIMVKGTGMGVRTDIKGSFRLQAPSRGKIIVAFIGYESQELDITPGKNYTIRLTESSQQLQEVVVVVGYGSQRRETVTGSLSTVYALQGRVAGINVQGAPGFSGSVQIRGLNSLADGKKPPLIVVDGAIITDEQLKAYNQDDIQEMTILKDEAAMAIYGARAANGVVVITTKKKALADKAEAIANGATGGLDLRRNFSDYAYWKPKLTTNAEGKVSFTSVFPDDMTNWRTFVVGINGQQTGFLENNIKAFKPLSAALITPVFAVKGDKMTAIGKVMNYGAEPVKLNRIFTYNGKQQRQDELTVANAKIDTLNITAADTDSLTFEYSINRENGYFDGEQRKIPVIAQGVEETKGVFEVLNGDTTVNLKFDSKLGQVTLHAEASALPALIEETERLRNYRYLCNEQLASKLKGLLIERRIKTYLNEPFTHDDNVADIIKKLLENRGTQGIWGWWKESNSELWISLHAVGALMEAEKEGYKVSMDKQVIINYLVYQLESYHGRDKLTCLELLQKVGATVDYKKYANALYKESLKEIHVNWLDRFRIMTLLQQVGVDVDVNSVLKIKKETMFGNIYWGEENYYFFDNSIQLSLQAYRLFKAAGKNAAVLEKIRGYLLEQRRDGGWRNTYESSLILETILPDMLLGGKTIKPSSLKLSGAKTDEVNTFPYTTTFSGTQVSISKIGSLPVYITGYQKFWNRQPEKVSKDFTVDTWFERNNTKVTKLKGAEKVELKAKVTARADGEFVMIEIPIPAGCSYDSKEQGWANGEVHREYFKEKVSIFCRKLKQGTYTFTVNLMPRYDGEYTLNPAKAELMYFPVFYGREAIKQVAIGSK